MLKLLNIFIILSIFLLIAYALYPTQKMETYILPYLALPTVTLTSKMLTASL